MKIQLSNLKKYGVSPDTLLHRLIKSSRNNSASITVMDESTLMNEFGNQAIRCLRDYGYVFRIHPDSGAADIVIRND